MTQLKVALHMCIGIILGLLFYGYGNNAANTLSNSGFFIVTVTYLAYTAMLPAVCTYPLEVRVIKKECFNNWYKLRTYYLAGFLVSIPTQMMFTLSYSAICYYMSGQPLELNRICMFHLAILLLNIAADSYGIFFGTVFNPINGTFVGAVFTAFSLLLGGYFVQFKHMNAFFYLLSYTSFYSYAWDALMHTIYGFNRDKIPCSEDFCLFTSPTQFMNEFGIENYYYWNDVMCLVGIICLMKIVGFYTLKRLLHNN